MLVSEVPHEAWDACKASARALAAPIGAVTKGRESCSGWERSCTRHNKGSHSRLRGGAARANESLCRTCRGGYGPETGANAVGGGLPRYDGAGKSEN